MLRAPSTCCASRAGRPGREAGRRSRLERPAAMSRPALEVADIFREHGAAWRHPNAGHVSLDQIKVMSAIERCRTVALVGHVARCEGCAHTDNADTGCRNRHCPKCQGAAAREWLGGAGSRVAPGAILPRRLHAARPDRGHRVSEQEVIYDILFKASAETMITIAADP